MPNRNQKGQKPKAKPPESKHKEKELPPGDLKVMHLRASENVKEGLKHNKR